MLTPEQKEEMNAALSQFVGIDDFLSKVQHDESLFSNLDAIFELLLYQQFPSNEDSPSCGHTLLMAAIVNQHPLADKLLEQLGILSADQIAQVLCQSNLYYRSSIDADGGFCFEPAGITVLRAAVLIESQEFIQKIVNLIIQKLPMLMQKEVLSLLVSTRDTFTQNEVYFSRINGRQVCLDQELNLTASQKFLDNRKFSGNLIELALAIKNHGIASLLIRTLEDLRVPVSGLLEYREQIERVCILQEEEVAFQGLKNERFRLFSQFVLVGRLLGEPESESVMGIVAEYYPRLPR